MAFNNFHKAAVGTALAIGLFAGRAVELQKEDRPEFPDGLVCATELGPGESPHTLAEESAFADDAESVIERSQFINPDALLSFSEGNEQEFTGYFNVIRGDRPAGTPSNRPYFSNPDASCTTNEVDHELSATTPSIEAAARILESTVALREREPSNDEFGYWRCGAIAVSESMTILTAPDYISGTHSCVDLAKGESGDSPLDILSDDKVDGFRLVDTTGEALKPAEIAPADYTPEKGEVMVYSGYSRGGSRRYFRVRFGGELDGRMVFVSDIDRVWPEDDTTGDPDYLDVRSGSGGLFNLEGQLVATLESTNMFHDLDRMGSSVSESYYQRSIDHNAQLAATLSDFDLDPFAFGTNGVQGTRQRVDQVIFGLRVPTDIVTSIEATGE